MKRAIDPKHTKARKSGSLLLAFDSRHRLLLLLQLAIVLLAASWSRSSESEIGVQAFAPHVIASHCLILKTRATVPCTRISRSSNVVEWFQQKKKKFTVLVVYNKGNDDDDNGNNNNNDNNSNSNNDDFDFDWISKLLDRAGPFEIRRDAVLVSCYVLFRFLIYDITTGTKITPGWEIQDLIWLTGTFSSATVLVTYWTIAGLLSRSFEISDDYYSPIQVLVNVALCCPIWLATEHLLRFGPPDVGGNTLSVAITTGFVGLGSFMTLAKALTTR